MTSMHLVQDPVRVENTRMLPSIAPEGTVRLINHEACRILEVASEAASSRDLAALVPGNHRLLEAAEKVRSSHRSRAEGEVVLRRRSGTEVLLDITLSPVTENESATPGVLIVLRDRTAFKELSDDDSLQKQLNAYGHIAAGIAHEVKNPLGGIRGAAELLQKRSTDERSERTAHLSDALPSKMIPRALSPRTRRWLR